MSVCVYLIVNNSVWFDWQLKTSF